MSPFKEMSFGSHVPKEIVAEEVGQAIKELGLPIVGTNLDYIHGGLHLIDPSATDKFIESFFPELKEDPESLTPRVILADPSLEPTFHSHGRRLERPRIIAGTIELSRRKVTRHSLGHVVTVHSAGSLVPTLQAEAPHSIKAVDNWAVIAELWQHTTRDQRSDDLDFVNLQGELGTRMTPAYADFPTLL